MQQFVAILIGSEDWTPDEYTEQDWKDEMQLHVAFQDAVKAAGGRITSSDALAPSKDAVLIKGGPANPVFTDGPFTELKEIVNGFYVMEVEDLETAKRLAAMIPAASVQLFPVFDVRTPSGLG